MMTQVNYFPSLFSWATLPAIKPYQARKVMAVALAAFTFFGLQFSCSLMLSGGMSLASSLITLLSESKLRTNTSEECDWFSRDQIKRRALVSKIAFSLFLLPAFTAAIFLCGLMPLQTASVQIMARNLKTILLAIAIAPLTEEILFRGFLQERMEDACHLVDRHIYSLSDDSKTALRKGCQLVTSLFFGAIHIIGNQVPKKSLKLVVFYCTTSFGFILSEKKKSDQSLLSPIAIHSAQNTGNVLGLLIGGALRPLNV